jgi:hypothetical protein
MDSAGRKKTWRVTGEYAERRDRGLQPVSENGFRAPRWIPKRCAPFRLKVNCDPLARAQLQLGDSDQIVRGEA